MGVRVRQLFFGANYTRRMSSQRVTVADIARAAGVSVGTVSNALNGRRSQTAQATIDHVLATAERLGYRGNSAAAALRTGHHGVIGLLLPRLVRALSFYMDFALGVEEAAARADLDLMLVTADRPAGINRVKVDGAIVVDWTHELAGPAFLKKAGIPVVSAGGTPVLDASPDRVVRVEYETYVRQIVSAAHSAGARRALMLAADSNFQSDWARATQEAFQSSCEELNIESMTHPIAVNADRDSVLEIAEDVARRFPAEFVLVGPQRFAGILNSKFGWGSPSSDVRFLASCAGDPVTELASTQIAAIDAGPRAFGDRCVTELVQLMNAGVQQEFATTTHPASVSWPLHWGRPAR